MDPIPIPRDIPLPLPANGTFMEALLIIAFMAHLLFVNLMLGGALLVLAFQVRGLRQTRFDRLARALATTVTVNKSMAVVLGVAPLLLINVLYTIHFYTANALTGSAWILVIPGVAMAFLLLYLHKYTWDRLTHNRGLHISFMAFAVAILLVIPLVFLANINLMLFPEHWAGIHGFFSALALPNVFPRFFHFLCASLIVTSLFGVAWFGRAGYPVETKLEGFSRPELRRVFYSIAFSVSLAQFVVGPLVLFTIPSKGLQASVILAIGLGVVLAIAAVMLMWREMTALEPGTRRLPLIIGYLTLTVFCMIAGRHMYREMALTEHRAQMQAATAQYMLDVDQAAYDLKMGIVRAPTGGSPGQTLFETNCGMCHAAKEKLIGPAITEIAKLYKANPSGIVTWAKAPGKKRPDFPQMPPFIQLGEANLGQIADYMLKLGAKP